MNEDRQVDTNERKEDREANLRPANFSEFIGQEKVIDRLKTFAGAAKLREGTLDHILLTGAPGLGKTTIAKIIANEYGSEIIELSAPQLDKLGNFAKVLLQLKPNSVLFIDEIHRLKRNFEETLYTVMEDRWMAFLMGREEKYERFEVENFTIVGATTRAGLLSDPFRNRFGIVQYMDFYSADELSMIITRSANILNMEIEQEGAKEIGRRSRGTPRLANRNLKRVSDYAITKCDTNNITLGIAIKALDYIEIDKYGLDQMDRKLLLALIEHSNGKPVGLTTLSALIDEEKHTIEYAIEPFLLKNGFINKTSRGREATSKTYEYFGKKQKYNIEDAKFV